MRMRRRPSRAAKPLATVSASLTLAFTLSVSIVPHAVGTNFSGNTNSTSCMQTNMTDGGDHTYHYFDLSQDMKAATGFARSYNFDPTDLDTFYDSSLDGNTDVVVLDEEYTNFCGYTWWSPTRNGTIGLAKCDIKRASGVCNQHAVRYNLHWTSRASVNNQRSLACHENGHTAGLLHRNDGCMADPLNGLLFLSNHDINQHVNPNYP